MTFSRLSFIKIPQEPRYGMLLFFILYSAGFGFSVGPVAWVIISQIFPTAVRGRALGLAAFFLWTADFVVTQTFPMMDAKGSWFVAHFQHAFPFYSMPCFAWWCCCWSGAWCRKRTPLAGGHRTDLVIHAFKLIVSKK